MKIRLSLIKRTSMYIINRIVRAITKVQGSNFEPRVHEGLPLLIGELLPVKFG